VIAFFLLFHPSLSSKLPPELYSTQHHLLTDGKRKVLNIMAGEIIALMTPFDAFIVCTGPDGTSPTEYEEFVREAPLALNFIRSYSINTR
jgi:hypothetical protein